MLIFRSMCSQGLEKIGSPEMVLHPLERSLEIRDSELGNPSISRVSPFVSLGEWRVSTVRHLRRRFKSHRTKHSLKLTVGACQEANPNKKETIVFQPCFQVRNVSFREGKHAKNIRLVANQRPGSSSRDVG